MIKGLHHITAISSSAQKTVDFYRDFLGLRFIKKTVNFDAPDVYHLYFGDNSGKPGSAITFFPFEDAGTGMRGTKQATSIAFAIPAESLGFWMERAIVKGVKHSPIKTRFNQKYITIYDYDGLELELFVTSDPEINNFETWKDSPIAQEHQIRGFHTTTLAITELQPTVEILENIFGYTKLATEENYTRFELKNGSYSKFIDILHMPGWPEGIQSAGIVHHVAFSVATEEDQETLRKKLAEQNLKPTQQVERKYFKSVYFREPGGILFEIATEKPGFTIDESLETLGTTLQLPEQYEPRRNYIEAILPPIDSTRDSQSLGYDHIYIKGETERTLVMLHGTGADEKDLLNLAQQIDSKANILSLRGKENENGMLRFFKRYDDGTFDIDDIKKRSKEITEFLRKAIDEYKLNLDLVILCGFSNGANMVASMLLLGDYTPKAAILLRPTLPLEEEHKIDLQNTKIFIASGKQDSYSTEEKLNRLVDLYTKSGAKVEWSNIDAEHQLTIEDLSALFKWYEEFKS